MAQRLGRACKLNISYKEQEEKILSLRTKRPTLSNDKRLYDVEITERDHENKRVKLQYVGYSNKCDVWISSDTVCPIVKSKKLSTVSQKSYEDRLNSFLDKCRNEI